MDLKAQLEARLAKPGDSCRLAEIVGRDGVGEFVQAVRALGFRCEREPGGRGRPPWIVTRER